MCFYAILWSTFTFLYLLLQRAMFTFQYNNHLVLDILIVKQKSIYSKPTSKSSFMTSKFLTSYHRISSMVRFSFKAYLRSAVRQVHLPPPMGLLDILQCTIGLTSLPRSSTISIRNMFMTLSVV